ncbi:MAG: GNAT family N-acetyltransferase [Ruminococcaceae bacterium]|nr:GNAT family N-acetyltransferase [Oscillospiraceae bacterium]
MELRILSKAELKDLYYKEMKRAFPPSELKPLKSMEDMRDTGRYEPLGLFEGEELLGYALVWMEPDIPHVLLDYLGTMEGKRGAGLGTKMLGLLQEHYAHRGAIFGESERDNSPDPEERALQRRRLEFYFRNGLRYAGYDCALFGVHYETLILGGENVTAEELMQAHQTIYRRQIPPKHYERFVQIPLAPGEKPNPAVEWREE